MRIIPAMRLIPGNARPSRTKKHSRDDFVGAISTIYSERKAVFFETRRGFALRFESTPNDLDILIQSVLGSDLKETITRGECGFGTVPQALIGSAEKN